MDSWKTVINATLAPSPTNKVGTTLSLTVRGEEAKLGWHFRTIRYAVNRVVLHFQTAECSLPEEDWAFDAINLSEVEIAQEVSETVETNRGLEGGWAGSISATVQKGSFKASKSRTAKTVNAKSTRFSTVHRPVLAHGTATNPSWSLTSAQTQTPLLGTLIKHDRFCRVEPNGLKPKVSISFEIPYDALLFRQTDGSFLSGNKFGIARLLLRATICERKHSLCEMNL